MIKIAHRANINGKTELENHPATVWNAISNGYNVEIDTWLFDNQWYFGHDRPEHKVSFEFLNSVKTLSWIHCKNLEALKELDPKEFNFFWHQQDDFTLTSKGYIWTYPEKNISKKSVIVDLDIKNIDKYKNIDLYGICTDYPSLIE
jgi:hypothetical protein